jgi:hypothetical protein
MKKKITFTLLAALTLLVTYPQITKAANIVKTVNVDQTIYFSTSGYFNATDTLSFQEIAEALGTDTASIDKTVSLTDGTSFLYAKDIDGNLTNKSTANTPGFWFDKNGVVSTWANGFFASEVHADAIENKLYIVNSGKPNTPIGSYTATEYIVMGDNQVQINVTLNIVEKPAVNWGGIQFVKSFDVTIDEYPDNKYATKEQVLKLSDVAAALGTTPETMETLSGTGIVYAKDTLGYSDSYTGGGINQFWL